ALTQTAELQHLLQHWRILSSAHPQSNLISQGGIGCDFRYGHQPQKPVVATHNGYDVRLDADRCLTLALVVRDDIVNCCHGEIELAFDQALQLILEARRGRQMDLYPIGSKVALLLRRPDRPIKPTREDDDFKRQR